MTLADRIKNQSKKSKSSLSERLENLRWQESVFAESEQRKLSTAGRLSPASEPAATISAMDALRQQPSREQMERARLAIPDAPKRVEPEVMSMNMFNNETAGGYIANRAASGFESAAFGMDKTRRLLQGGGDIPDMPMSYEGMKQTRLEDKRIQDRTETAIAGESKSKVVKWIGDRAEQIAQQIPNIMLNYASGGAAQIMTAGFASAQAIGNSYDQAKQEGADHEKALKYGVIAGLLEGAVEVISGGVPGMKGALDAPIDAIAKPIKNRVLKIVAKQGMNVLGEGLEEGLTSALDPLIRRGTFDPAAKTTLAQITNDMLEGIYTSAVMMGLPTAIEARNVSTISNQAIASELIATAKQEGNAYEMLQQKPVSEMTTDEQVNFIETMQEELELKQELQELGLTEPEKVEQNKDMLTEPPKIVSKPLEATDENIPVKKAIVKPQRGQETQKQQETIAQEQAVDSLPETQEELTALVKDMEEQQKNGVQIDLQLFSAAKDKLKKISQFRTNTIERTQKLTDEERAKLDPQLFGYDVESNKEWASDAEFNVANYYEGTKKRIESADSISGGVQAYEAALITDRILQEARKTGDYTELLDWMPKVAEKTRESARALSATKGAYDPKSPLGAIAQVQRTVNEVSKKILEDSPSTKNRIANETKRAKDAINRSRKQAKDTIANDIETLTPEKMLANRIESHMKEGTETESDPIKDMVNELYRVAQESPLPDKAVLSKKDPFDFVAQAIKNREQYQDIFDKAKKIVEEKFKDNPGALQLLDSYFSKEAVPVFSQLKFNQAIKNEIRNLDKTISDIAKSGRKERIDIFKAVAERMMEKGSLTQDEANYLVPFLVDSYDMMVKEKAADILGSMLKDPKKKSDKTSSAQRIKDIVRMGETDTDTLNRVLSEKYGLPVMDEQTIKEISDLYEIIDTGDIKGIKDSIVKESKLEGKEKARLEKLLGDTNFGIDKYRALALAQISKKFSDKQKVTFARKLSTAQYIAHLFGVKSPLRNKISNTTLKGLEKVSETISSVLFPDVTRSSLKYSQEAKEAGKQAKQQEMLDILLGVNSRAAEKGKFNTYTQGTFKNKVLSTLEKATTLALSDAYAMEIRRVDTENYLKAMMGVDKVTPEITEQADREIKYATLRDDSLPAQILQLANAGLNIIGFGKRISKTVNILGRAVSIRTHEFGLGDLIVKYAKVPGNIIARTVEYSPVGYLKTLYQLGVAKATHDTSPMSRRQAALSFGRATTGTGLMIMSYALSALGLLVQRDPDEDRTAAALSSAQGLNQTQINLSALGRILSGGDTKVKDGDTLVSISFLEPFATLLSAGASIQQALAKDMTAEEAISLTANNAVEELLDMPTTAIIQAIYQEASKEESSVGTVIAVPFLKAAPGFIPAPLRDMAKVIDSTARSASDSNIVERSKKEIKRNIPLLSTLLEPQVSPIGEEKKQFGEDILTRAINSMLNPGYTTRYKDIPYAGLLKEIKKKFPESQTVYPRYYAPGELQLDGKAGNEKLTDKEKTAYMKAYGRYLDEKYEALLQNKKIGSVTENTVSELLKIKKQAGEKGKQAVKKYRTGK